jgi:hypothetical protein
MFTIHFKHGAWSIVIAVQCLHVLLSFEIESQSYHAPEFIYLDVHDYQ